MCLPRETLEKRCGPSFSAVDEPTHQGYYDSFTFLFQVMLGLRSVIFCMRGSISPEKMM
jgi:hypothetical protein